MILSSLAMTAGAGGGLDYGDFLQLRVAPPLAVPGKVTLVVRFELFPGEDEETRGKVCWDPVGTTYATCSGDTSLCPKRPPPPNTAPPPGTENLLAFVSNTVSQLAGLPASTGLLDLAPSRGLLRFASVNDVIEGLNSLFALEVSKPTSFHIVRVGQVLSAGPFGAPDLLDKILAIPVTGDSDLIEP